MSDTAQTPRRAPRLFLIVSLCLNVALVGLIAMAAVRTQGRAFEPHEGHGGLNAQALMRLAPAEKDRIEAVVKSHHAAMHALRADAMEARRKAFDLLAARDFDAKAFAASLDAIQSADAALEAETMKQTAQSVAVLTPAERTAVADGVRKPGRALLKRFFRHR